MLNEYFIFCIKEKFAQHYFHKSDLLYQFLKMYNNDQNNVELFNQFHYITNEFPKMLLIAHLKNEREPNECIRINDQSIVLSTNSQSMTLHIFDKLIKFHCPSLYEAEHLLLARLRRFHPYLFVTCQHKDKYGWITPMTMNPQLNVKQLLSS